MPWASHVKIKKNILQQEISLMVCVDRENRKGRLAPCCKLAAESINFLPFQFSWALLDMTEAHPSDSPIKKKVRFSDSVFQYSIFPCYFRTSVVYRIKPNQFDLLVIGLTFCPFAGCWLFWEENFYITVCFIFFIKPGLQVAVVTVTVEPGLCSLRFNP